MAFVIDASVVLSWHFADENAVATEALFERSVNETVVVPHHWGAEVANGLLTGERKRRATMPQSSALVHRLEALDVETDFLDWREHFSRILPLARAHGLTIYDTLYLELAERRALALATVDRALADAARSVGLEVLPK